MVNFQNTVVLTINQIKTVNNQTVKVNVYEWQTFWVASFWTIVYEKHSVYHWFRNHGLSSLNSYKMKTTASILMGFKIF